MNKKYTKFITQYITCSACENVWAVVSKVTCKLNEAKCKWIGVHTSGWWKLNTGRFLLTMQANKTTHQASPISKFIIQQTQSNEIG